MSFEGARIRAVCFDFDGTLADTMGYLARVAEDVIAAEYGVPKPDARRAYLRSSGLPFRAQLERMFPGDPRNEGVSETFERLKREKYLELPPVPGAKACLLELRECGFKVIISSSTTEDLLAPYVRGHEIPCDLLLGHGKGFSKGKSHFEAAGRYLGIQPWQTLYVGDSLNDYHLAREAGVGFIAVEGIFNRDDFRRLDENLVVLRALGQLVEVLSGAAARGPAPDPPASASEGTTDSRVPR